MSHAAVNVKDALALSTFASFGVVVGIQFHVQLTEKELTTGHHACIERLLIAQLLKHLFGQRFPSFVVFGESIDSGTIVTPIFHELGRKLYCIPLDAVDSGNITYGCLG